MRQALLFFLTVLLASPALASPWPRPAGERFLSLSREGASLSVWGEAGLDGRHWLVGRLERAQDGARTAGFALRRSLVDDDAVHRLALSLGAEFRDRDRRVALRPGLSWGRGVTRPWQGWVTASAEALVPVRQVRQIEWEGRVTLGAQPAPAWLAMVQLQAERRPQGQRLYVAPSVAWEWRTGTHLQLGLRQRVGGDRRRRVTLASWLRF